jgi:hypothetical protein
MSCSMPVYLRTSAKNLAYVAGRTISVSLRSARQSSAASATLGPRYTMRLWVGAGIHGPGASPRMSDLTTCVPGTGLVPSCASHTNSWNRQNH